MEDQIKPGDLYEDAFYHPCLCTSADYDFDEICGISLIDGSTPRCCSIEYSARKLSLEEAIAIKESGPKDENDQPIEFFPDKQWWNPKPLAAINPGTNLEFFFSYSLIVVRNNEDLKALLGEAILGWYEPTFRFVDDEEECMAEIQYLVKSQKGEAVISVRAEKIEKRRWECLKILATLKSNRKSIEILNKC